MNKIFAAFLLKFTFQRQLGITVTLGVLMLALFSSVMGSWQANERVRNNLLEQGQRITESLARQSTLALIYASADNAVEAANATLNFPGVVGVEIRDDKQHILLKRGEINSAEFPHPVDHASGTYKTSEMQAAAVLDAESQNAWRFSAPVYSQPSSSPFREVVTPELLGHVTVVLSKAALTQVTTSIFIANLITSFSFALLFLFLIRFLSNRITRPLNQLSACMGRAEAGELQVRAVLAGPQDIADMAHAFNSMMSVLEEHATEIRQLNIELEQRVAQRTAQLEASIKELEEFSYSMSHDMRTPLRALDGFSKILLEEHAASLDDEGKRLAMVLRDNAKRMGRLIDDILHYLSMGRKKMEFSSIDIAKLASEIIVGLQAAAPARRLKLEIGTLPPAWGDRDMIREVLQNLLSNAIKFSPDSEALIEISGTAEKDEHVYSVTDHGIGFDMRYANKLFRVFERVHSTGQYEGSGIGLALVERIVTRHGGRVWAEGKVNEGATIYFALPEKEIVMNDTVKEVEILR
jgi:signal transduction histidine kinase